MLWSLVKILVFVGIIVGLTFGAGYIMETGPGVRLVIGTMEFNLGPLQAVLASLVLLAIVWVILRLAGLLVATLRFVNGDETAISRYFNRNRERKGYRELSESLLALSSGEGRKAMTMAQRAERHLQKPEITNLVVAQAAELVGDKRVAERTYKEMLANDKTRFVGIRGLLDQKLAEGDNETALALAEKALAIRPANQAVQDTLLRLQAEKHDWKGARKTLGAKLKHGGLPRDVHRRRDAVLALSQAKEVLEEGNSIDAREAAIEANKLSPDMVPAAVMAARSYIEQGKPRYAARVVKKAWEAQPHPELATAFAEIVPDEAPKARVARFEPLLRLRADHPEAKMLKAELLIAAEDFPGARRAMGDLATSDPTARALSIMAAIERGEGADEAVVRGWLAKAVTAPRGPQWVCDNCSNIEPVWGPICSNCNAFDTLTWTTPSKAEIASPTGAEMLPLIVGAPGEAASGPDAANGPARDDEASETRYPSEGEVVDVTPSTNGADSGSEGDRAKA